MKMLVVNRRWVVFILATLLITFRIQGASYAQVGNPTVTASTQQPVTDATLDGSVVTLTLSGGTYVRFRWDIADALTVSGIPGVTIGQFNQFGQLGPAWFGVKRLSDTEITVGLGFDGAINTDTTLTFTVGAGAIANYNGPALTAEVPVIAQAANNANNEVEIPDTSKQGPPDALEDSGQNYIEGPWLWMIVPTGPAGDRGLSTEIDSLAGASGGAITEAHVAQNGVNEGDSIGQLRWTSSEIHWSGHQCHKYDVKRTPNPLLQILTLGLLQDECIDPTVCWENNISNVVSTLGMGTGVNTEARTAYALINLISFSEQRNVILTAQSGDAIKIWLNGNIVHRDAAESYGSRKINVPLACDPTVGISDPALQESDVSSIPVTLKAGNNLLLVKVRQHGEYWGMRVRLGGDFTVAIPQAKTTANLPPTRTQEIPVTTTAVSILPTPDLVVDSPRVNTSILAPGESFTFSATVRNKGDGPASATTLQYYRSSDRTRGTEVSTEAVSALASNGTSDASIQLTAPAALGTYTYSACISSVTSESNTDNNCTTSVRITVQLPPEELVTSSGNNQNGTLNSQLTDPLAVQVLDADGNGVANVKVTFRITAGQGRLSSRGNRSSIGISTNSRGFAEVPFTPTRAGTVTVEASIADLDPMTFTVTVGEPPAELVKVSGDTQHGKLGTRLANPFVVEVQDKDGNPVEGVQVTFRVTAGGGILSTATATTDTSGRAQTSLTLGSRRGVNTVQASVETLDDPVTFRAAAEAEVLIAASQRPPMYWMDIQAGTLHRLIGDSVEDLVPNVQNATSLTVDMTNGKLYWTEKTGGHTGRIRRANLDGSNVQLVKDLTSVPLAFALDTTGGKLYLINGWGKIQRLNLDGSNFQPNLITGLEAPMHLTLDTAGGKVYWTEQTGDRTGKIRRANLDGSNVQLVKDLTSAPLGLAADITNSKLYLSNAWGKIQRLNFDGSNYQPNFITDLESPGELAVDVAGSKFYWTEGGSLRRADLTGEKYARRCARIRAFGGYHFGHHTGSKRPWMPQ